MIRFSENYSLKQHNSFGIEARAKYFFEFTDVEDLSVFLNSNKSIKDEKIIEPDMKYPSILNHVIIGVVIILTALIMLYIIIIINFQKIDSISHQIIDHPFTVSNTVKDINIHVNNLLRTMRTITVLDDEDELNTAITKINEEDTIVQNLFKIVEEKYLGNKSDIEKAYKTFNESKSIRNEVINLVKQGEYLWEK